MSQPSKQTKSNKKSRKPRRRREKREKQVAVTATPRPPRARRARTKFNISAFGASANLQHDWAMPAAIGNVTVTPTTRHKFTITHTDEITTVLGNPTVIPSVTSIYINPMRYEAFPYCSQIAAAFELYRFKKLRYRYQPSVGTSETGTLTMGIDYDAGDSTFADDQALMAIPGSAQGSTFTAFTMSAIDGGRSSFAKDLFLSDTATSDLTKNFGRLYFMITGTTTAATTAIGKIYCDYTVELTAPAIPAAGTALAQMDQWVGTNAPKATLFSTLVPSNVTARITYPGNAANRLYFYRPGLYVVYLGWACTDGNVSTPSINFGESAGVTFVDGSALNRMATNINPLITGLFQVAVWDGYLQPVLTNPGTGTLGNTTVHIFNVRASPGIAVAEPSDPIFEALADPAFEEKLEEYRRKRKMKELTTSSGANPLRKISGYSSS